MERDQRLNKEQLAEQNRIAHYQLFRNAHANLQLAKANLALLKAGVWEADKAIAYASLQQARPGRASANDLGVDAGASPAEGTILQVNLRPGEYVAAATGQSLIVMGNTHPLYVRVNIDEEDLPRLRLEAPARAKVRGDPTQEEIKVRFVRLEPYVVPKTSLTGINTERVDTRVVQLIYAVEPGSRLVMGKKVLVGQLLDVFIDTRSTAADKPSITN